MENVNQNISMTIDQMMGEVFIALESAIEKYGAEAVDLGLLVFQIEAIRVLISPLIWFILSIFFIIFFIKVVVKGFLVLKETGEETIESAGRIVSGGLGIVLFTIGFIVSLTEILNPVLWIAAFGYPEVYIATNALRSLGLM